MFSKLFNFPAFIIALALGLLFVYLSDAQKDIVYVYPTPNNLNQVEYKDSAGNCFDFTANKLDCPEDINKIKSIPIQTIEKKN
tara:strand:+ start:1658 stop:1906 length:249 start_codon:yes stop_codon:yes gene_type:complete